MPIEAELKAHVHDPVRVRAWLRERAAEEVSTYHDVYFDYPDRSLTRDGRELRVRVIESATGTRALLTYKAPAVDAASGSKPEYETEVSDPDSTRAILDGLGYSVLVAFAKHCHNYRFSSDGRDILATIVTVSELPGTFLEVESITEDELPEALAAVRAVLTALGIGEMDITTERYADAVIERRRPS